MCYFFKYFNVLKLVKITNCTISITKRKKIGHQDLCIIKLPNYFGHVEKNEFFIFGFGANCLILFTWYVELLKRLGQCPCNYN